MSVKFHQIWVRAYPRTEDGQKDRLDEINKQLSKLPGNIEILDLSVQHQKTWWMDVFVFYTDIKEINIGEPKLVIDIPEIPLDDSNDDV